MSELSQSRLVLFPGLGVDAELYAPQRALPVRLELPAWPAPESSDETLAHYARRLAAQVEPGGRLFLGGASLGAMVALEAARHIECSGVFMIGGCRSYRDLSPLFKLVCTLAGRLPASWLGTVLAGGPLAFRMFEALPPEQAQRMAEMLRAHDLRQTRWSARAIMQWEMTEPPGVPVWSIHGEHDEVIPLRNVRADRVVARGRHLISLSHPDAVNAFLMEGMGVLGAPGPPDRPAMSSTVTRGAERGALQSPRDSLRIARGA